MEALAGRELAVFEGWGADFGGGGLGNGCGG